MKFFMFIISFSFFISIFSLEEDDDLTFLAQAEKSLMNKKKQKFNEIKNLIDQDHFDQALQKTRALPKAEAMSFTINEKTETKVTVEYWEKNQIFLKIASSFRKKGNFIQAVSILDNDIDFSRLQSNKNDEEIEDNILFLLDISLEYVKNRKIEKGLKFVDKALALVKDLKMDIDGSIDTNYYLHACDIYLVAGNVPKAIDLLDKTVKNASSHENISDKIFTFTQASARYLRAGEKDIAIKLVDESSRLAETTQWDDEWDLKQVYKKIDKAKKLLASF